MCVPTEHSRQIQSFDTTPETFCAPTGTRAACRLPKIHRGHSPARGRTPKRRMQFATAFQAKLSGGRRSRGEAIAGILSIGSHSLLLHWQAAERSRRLAPTASIHKSLVLAEDNFRLSILYHTPLGYMQAKIARNRKKVMANIL